jgi:hypothetical protein
MAPPRLRVIFGPDDTNAAGCVPASTQVQNEVTVTLGDVLPLLVDASEMQRAWLKDFKDDKIKLSSDLFEVLLAYQSMRSAA